MKPEEVRAARERLGLTQSQLAARLKLSEPYGSDVVRSWEKGRRPISGPAQVAIELFERVRELEIELGINPERNAALVKAAGKPMGVIEASARAAAKG